LQKEVRVFSLLSSKYPVSKIRKKKDLVKSIRPSPVTGRANSVLWFFAYANLMLPIQLFFNELISGEKQCLKGDCRCHKGMTYLFYD
jgi:hypothetical protein